MRHQATLDLAAKTRFSSWRGTNGLRECVPDDRLRDEAITASCRRRIVSAMTAINLQKIAPMTTAPLILLAAGGTGGHLFPAEALGVELIRRGLRVRLATDARALRYSGLFSKDTIDVVPSATVRSRNPLSLAYTVLMLGYGTLVAAN